MSTPPVSPRVSKAAPAPSPNRRGQSSAGFPFPTYESPRRPGSSRAGSGPSALRPRRDSNASSILSLDSKRGADTIAEAGSNAISALLQPPIIRTGLLPHTHAPSGIRPPSTRDIPPVTLTNIPHVDSNVFNSYIQQAGSLYNALRKAREEQAGPGDRRPSSSRRGSELSDDGGGAGGTGGGRTQYHGMQRRPSAAAAATPTTPGVPTITVPATPLAEAPPTLRRKSSIESASGVRRRPGLAVAPLSTIPTIYFDDDFHLENPRTFDVVSEKSEIIRQPAGKEENGDALAPLPGAGVGAGRRALAANAILQEKLSWYMDTVEIHLIQSISTASTSFFDALKELRDLHAQAEASVRQIQVLRQDLVKLDEDMAVGGLEVVAMKTKRDNVRRLGDAVRQLEAVMDGFSRCETQIQDGKIDDALEGLGNLEKLIAGDDGGRIAGTDPKSADGFQGSLIDLRGLKALGTAFDDIDHLRKKVGTTLEARFIATLLADLRRHVDQVAANNTFKRWSMASSRRRGQHARTPSEFGAQSAYMDVDPGFRDDLHNQLKGLAKAGTIMPTTFGYREAVQKEFKNLIRRHIPSSSDDDAESTVSVATTASHAPSASQRSAILARNLRALDPEDAETMFRNIYANIGEALRRLSTQVKVVLDITSSLAAPPPVRSPPPRTPSATAPTMSPRMGAVGSRSVEVVGEPLIHQEEIQQVLDLSSLLGQVVDISQHQITKLLKVRAEQSINLEIPFFLRYFTLNRLFADECEAVSGKSGAGLTTVVQDHIKSFMQKVGDAERQALVHRMDADLWDARDFGAAESSLLKAITDASTMHNEEWAKATTLWTDEVNGDIKSNGLGIAVPSIIEPTTPSSKENGVQGDAGNGALSPGSGPATPISETPNKNGKPTVRAAELDSHLFLLPSSPLAVLSGIITHLQLVTCMPLLAPDIALSLLAYLQLFNSRSQQLILGAGATRSAGLKTITAKHLALSSQALSFVAALVPYIRECVRRYLPTAGAGSGILADFDKVKRSLQEHQVAIVDKLVEIMSGRAVAQVVSFKKIDWEKPDSGNVGAYMETLAKETTTLQKTLMRYLPEDTVRSIMVQVMSDYRDVWTKAFGIVEVRSAAAKDRLKRDAEYFRARIGRLEGARDIGDRVVTIVDEKKVVGEEPAASVAAQVKTDDAKADNKENGEKSDEKNGQETKEEGKDSN